MNSRSYIIIFFIVAALLLLTYLEINESGLNVPSYAFILIVLSFFFFVGLLVWQERRADVFPQMSKFLVGIIPLLTLGVYFILASSGMDISLLLSVIFGLAGLFSLAMSIAVLVRIRDTISTEMELLIEATKLLRSAHKRLIFISLSLNFGYAAAIAEKKTHLIKAFEKAFEDALKRLSASTDNDKQIVIAYLNDDDIKTFFETKGSRLKELTFPVKYEDESKNETGEDIYLRRSKKLLKIVENQTKPDFFLIKRYKGCLQKASGDKLIPNGSLFPPLGILIIDEAAIISYNISILDPDPVPLDGHVTREKEQVEAIRVFSETYLNGFT